MSALSKVYTHTHHFVSLEAFDAVIADRLQRDFKLKSELKALMASDIWTEARLSSFFRHYMTCGGLSGLFTEYLARGKQDRSIDYWGAPIQGIDRTYLGGHAIAKAYQATVATTQRVLCNRVEHLNTLDNKEIKIASLACGTMYDVLEAPYNDFGKIHFFGYDTDRESLELARQKVSSLEYAHELQTAELDVVESVLPTKEYDIVVCNGFSFYLDDIQLSKLITNVERALKSQGIFVMSFVQPPQCWSMSDEEKKVSAIMEKIFKATPAKWDTHVRTPEQLTELFHQKGLSDVEVLDEPHHLHPCIVASKV